MLFREKFGLSRASAKQVCEQLKYDAQTEALFLDSVDSHHHRSPKERESARIRLLNRRRIFNSLDLDLFSIIADSHHFAIMELLRIKELSEGDFKEIAESLGITSIEAKVAIERLLALKLIYKTETDRLSPSGSFLTKSQTPSSAIRKHHRQLIKKATDSIEAQEIDSRELRTLTLAIGREDLPEFSKLFDEFQKQVRNLAEKNQNKDGVYAWTMQFFDLIERKDP